MSTQTRIPIAGLLDGYEAVLTQMGYSLTTKLLLIKRAELIVRRHAAQGMEYINSDIIAGYSCDIDERYFKGEVKKRYYWSLKREIQ